MRKLLLAIAASLTLASQAAHADVVYTWNPISGDGSPSGALSIIDQAYRDGIASFQWDTRPGLEGGDPAHSKITSFSFNLFGYTQGTLDLTSTATGPFYY